MLQSNTHLYELEMEQQCLKEGSRMLYHNLLSNCFSLSEKHLALRCICIMEMYIPALLRQPKGRVYLITLEKKEKRKGGL